MAVNSEENSEQAQSVFKSEDFSETDNKQEENLLNDKSDKSKNEDEKPAANNVDGFAPGTDKTSYKKFSGEQCMVKKTDGEWRKLLVLYQSGNICDFCLRIIFACWCFSSTLQNYYNIRNIFRHFWAPRQPL